MGKETTIRCPDEMAYGGEKNGELERVRVVGEGGVEVAKLRDGGGKSIFIDLFILRVNQFLGIGRGKRAAD